MTKKAFITELRRNLQELPFDEQEAAIDYYEEYIQEAGEEDEETIIKQLGSPLEISNKLKIDYAINKPVHTSKDGTNKLLIIILALLALPLGLPLIATTFAVLLTIAVIPLTFIVTFGGLAIGLVLGGIFAFFGSFFLIATGVTNFLLGLGASLLLLGLGIFFTIATTWIVKITMKILVTTSAWLFNRFRKRGV